MSPIRRRPRFRLLPEAVALEPRRLLSAMVEMGPSGVPAASAPSFSQPSASGYEAVVEAGPVGGFQRAADVLVEFKAGGAVRDRAVARIEALGGAVEFDRALKGVAVVTLPEGGSPRQWTERMNSWLEVRFAEPNQRLQGAMVVPNDPLLASNWGLAPNARYGSDVTRAWSITTGSESVVVAVIDSGIDLNHPEFAGQLWVNPGEIEGTWRDDDGNGFVDDLHGWNFVTNSPNIQDDLGHGTHVAGIIAARGDNGEGIAGVAHGVRLMPIKFLDLDGSGTVQNAARAVYYAVDNGARIINASWSGGPRSAVLEQALRYAESRGVVFVTASGNEGVAISGRQRVYPASYTMSNVVAVASIDPSGRLSSFSNHGNTVAIAAPGRNIVSTWLGGDYRAMTGTSMAAPFVSGTLALVASAYPSLSSRQLVQRVLATVKPLPNTSDRSIRTGLVDADNALSGVTQQRTTNQAQRRNGVARPARRSLTPPRLRMTEFAPRAPVQLATPSTESRAAALATAFLPRNHASDVPTLPTSTALATVVFPALGPRRLGLADRAQVDEARGDRMTVFDLDDSRENA